MQQIAITPYHQQASTDIVAVPSLDVPDLASILTGQLAASSIAMYKRDVEAYVDFAQEQHLSWLDAQTLVSFRDALSLQSTMSPHTINRMLAAVKRLVREMASRHMLDDTTALQFDRVRGVQVKALKTRLKHIAGPGLLLMICAASVKRLIGLPMWACVTLHYWPRWHPLGYALLKSQRLPSSR